MTPEQLQSIEIDHAATQEAASFVLGLALQVVRMSRDLSKELVAWKASLPADKALDEAAEATFTPELHAWLDVYLQIGAMPLAENIRESKVRHIQDAMKLLELIPPIVTKKEKQP